MNSLGLGFQEALKGPRLLLTDAPRKGPGRCGQRQAQMALEVNSAEVEPQTVLRQLPLTRRGLSRT